MPHFSDCVTAKNMDLFPSVHNCDLLLVELAQINPSIVYRCFNVTKFEKLLYVNIILKHFKFKRLKEMIQ